MKVKSGTPLWLSLLLVIGMAAPARTAELSQAAADGFNRYAQVTEQHMDDQIRQGHFLWADTLPEPERAAAYEQLRRGKILVEKQEEKENGRQIDSSQYQERK